MTIIYLSKQNRGGNMLTDLRIKIMNFIKRNKWKVVLAIVAWSTLMVISSILANWKNDTPITTYTPYEPIIENGETTPKRWQDDIEETIKQYIEFCNNKEYDKAYEMISEDCRKNIYPSLEDFKSYVNYVFSEPKAYTIQNYSNRDNVYIYRLRLFEDILATGMTYSENLQYFEEKLVFTEKNGKLQLSVKSYIGEEELDSVYEDQYMKITVSNKSTSFDEEVYTVSVQNKTEYTIVLADLANSGEIAIETENGERVLGIEEKMQQIYVSPLSSNTFTLPFQKFFDEGIKTTGIKFNSVRILRSYSMQEEQKEEELANAIDLYSFTLPL